MDEGSILYTYGDEENMKMKHKTKHDYVPMSIDNISDDSNEDNERCFKWNKLGISRNLIKSIAPILLLVVFNVSYVMSQETCPYNIDEMPVKCIDFFKTTMSKWVLQTLVSAICMLTIIYLSLRKVFSRWWILPTFINFMIVFLAFRGSSMEHHGSINRAVLIFWCIVLASTFGIAVGLVKFYRCLMHKILFFTPFVVIFAFGFIFYVTKVYNSCEGWEKGLGGKSLINDGKHCTVPIPTYCEFNIRNHFFDVNKVTKQCDTKTMVFNYEMLLGTPLDGTDAQFLGYPRTEDYSNELKIDKETYREVVKASMIDLNATNVSQEKKDGVEFMLDLTDPLETKMTINVKQNATRAQEQKELREQIIHQEKSDGTYDTRIDKNVLVLYFDNLSRAHFYRKLPLLAEWLEQFTAKDSDIAVNEYFRYHSVYYNTLWSNNAMYYGEVGDLKNTSNNVFDMYSKNGYITGFIKDACEMTSNSFDPDHYDDVKIHRWDHHASAFTCDLNYDKSKAVTSLDMFHGKNSILRRCLYGKGVHEYLIDYIKQFWGAYPDNRKFLRTHFSEAHELSGELIGYIDEDIRDMLQYMHENGHLDDTVVMLVSDHGSHSVTFRVPVLPDNSRYIENYLPMMFQLTPKDIQDKYLTALESNEQSLVSSHDVYATLGYIATNSRIHDYPYIAEKIPEDRECVGDEQFLSACWCQHDVENLNTEMSKKPMFSFNF